jgi:hypothetical protein
MTSLKIFTSRQIALVQTKEDELAQTCDMRAREDEWVYIFIGKLKDKGNFVDQDVDGRVIISYSC